MFLELAAASLRLYTLCLTKRKKKGGFRKHNCTQAEKLTAVKVY
jgi:hypothetical protein